MDVSLVGWLSIPVMLVALSIGIPVAVVLGLVGILGYVMVSGWQPTLMVAGVTLYAHVAVYTFSVLPLFILMGDLAFHAGFAADIFDMAKKWMGGVTMGVAYATMVAYTFFAAACGSSIAATAAMAKIAVPEFDAIGYNKRLAVGVMAAGGTLAPMIPPSLLMVVYGIIAEANIAKLLIAGILPGILGAVTYMGAIFIQGKLNPGLGPKLAGSTWGDRFRSLKGTWGIISIVVIVMGGIYSGIFTPTEAGAIGAFAAFVLGVAARRLRGEQLKKCFFGSTKTSGTIFIIIATANMYGYFLAVSRLPTSSSELLMSLQVSKEVVILGIVVLYVILGCFLDMIAAMFITLPIILPGVFALGYDPIWFGVVMVQLCEIALLTPPYGLNLFVMKSVLPDMPMAEIIKGTVPFIGAAFVCLALLIIFPQIALFLPGLMR